jgi:hypothetical protein
MRLALRNTSKWQPIKGLLPPNSGMVSVSERKWVLEKISLLLRGISKWQPIKIILRANSIMVSVSDMAGVFALI